MMPSYPGRVGPQQRVSPNVACTPCRRVKMKCIVDTESSAGRCTRCTRKNLDCFFENHRRGRQPGSSSRLTNTGNAPRTTGAGRSDLVPDQALRSARDPQHSLESSINASQRSRPSEKADSDSAEGESFGQNIEEGHRSLAPSGILSEEAMTGDFSLENVFTIPGRARRVSNTTTKPSPTYQEPGLQGVARDPLAIGIVNMPIARSLFDSFFTYLNPFIAQFDPILHTFDWVRSRSPFLLTCILTAAARIFNAGLHPKLCKHAEKLLAEALVSYERSTEIVQSILLFTYWKEPEDCRSWQLVGYAIRMCIAMNWHRFRPEEDHATPKGTEMEVREQRNKERVWLVLFVYDRSICLQLGHPWMIHLDEFLRTSRGWHRSPFAVPNNDRLLIAFTELRRITADTMNFWPGADLSANQQLDSSLISFGDHLDFWENDWCINVNQVAPTDFMIKFYGAHCRLLLASSRLQLVQIENIEPVDEYVESCLTIGRRIFKLLTEDLAPSQLLYYAQDSVHIMTVYTTILLIKVLLSSRPHLSPNTEKSIIDMILAASEIFATQSINSTSSCIYQSRFLANVVTEYRRSAEDASHTRRRTRRQQPMPQPRQSILASGAVDTSSNATEYSHTTLEVIQSPVDMNNVQMIGLNYDGRDYLSSAIIDPFDNNAWEDLFANAGFSIDDGAFLPFDMTQKVL